MVTFTLHSDQLTDYSGNGLWRADAGRFDVMVGASAEDIRLRGSFTLMGDVESEAPAPALATKVTIRK